MTRLILSLFASCLVTMPVFATDTAVSDEKLMQYRQTVKQLGGSLKKELVTTMKSAGPIAALDVCHLKAPVITKEVTEKSQLEIGRTSVKYRNATNAPDAWEMSVLEKFAARHAAGEKFKMMEFAEVVDNEGVKQVRYMKAIGTGKPCMACHGSDLKPKVAEKIKALYPEDKATGFKVGELRGAFTITETLK